MALEKCSNTAENTWKTGIILLQLLPYNPGITGEKHFTYPTQLLDCLRQKLESLASRQIQVKGLSRKGLLPPSIWGALLAFFQTTGNSQLSP